MFWNHKQEIRAAYKRLAVDKGKDVSLVKVRRYIERGEERGERYEDNERRE